MQARLSDLLGELPEEIPVINRSVSLAKHVDARTAEVICDFYRRDFEKFGYHKDSYPKQA